MIRATRSVKFYVSKVVVCCHNTMARSFSCNRPDYESFLTRRSKARKPSAIRALQPLLRIPGMISLGGGFPNPSSFPFENLSLTLKDGEVITLEGQRFAEALQYSESAGLPELVALWKRMIVNEHRPRLNEEEWGVCVTGGSQDGLAKVFEMLVDEQRSLLVESPTYSLYHSAFYQLSGGALAGLQPMGCKLAAVATDGEGLIPEAMAKILKNWDTDQDGPAPRVLYTIPCGSNPTGATLSLERRHKVLQLASQYDLLIIEDDPYYYLQLDGRLPSLFSLCVDGRVIRCDSLSKILSSGIRIGFVSAPMPLLQRIVLHQQATALHTSGISQAIIQALLSKWEACDGFETHVNEVVKLYKRRRDTFLALCEKYLKGKATWFAPSAGMFVWFKLHGIDDSTELIKTKAMTEKVMLVPGRAFSPNGGPSPYVRAAFSTASEQDMELALQRFASLLNDNSPSDNLMTANK